jgi:hypothetical protein
MLIDRTYFEGDILIANANANTIPNPVGSLVDWFIQKYEPEFLEKALGLSLYEALKTGYSQPTPDQKWIDLVQGTIYTDCWGKQKRWRGLITQPASVLDAFDVLGRRDIVVGRGNLYDPLPGSPTTTIPPEFVGKQFVFSERAFGDLKPIIEYTVSGNVLTLVTGVFSVDDTYWYKAAQLAINTSTGASKQSPIANYVYYWYQRNLYTQTSTMSEVKTQTENALMVDPFQKVATAWSTMNKWYLEMVEFLDTRGTIYTEWDHSQWYCRRRIFGRMNEHGI